MKNILSLLLILLSSISLYAQDNTIEMADQLRSDGKIYVVVICVLVILIGLLIYLFKLDGRLKKLEKSYKD